MKYKQKILLQTLKDYCQFNQKEKEQNSKKEANFSLYATSSLSHVFLQYSIKAWDNPCLVPLYNYVNKIPAYPCWYVHTQAYIDYAD